MDGSHEVNMGGSPRAAFDNLAEGWWQLAPAERRAGFEAFNILHAARLQWGRKSLTFSNVYDVYVERVWANRYIDELLALSAPVEQQSILRRRFAALVAANLAQIGFVRGDRPDSQVLLAYVLHWWESFAVGYAFEVEIYHDFLESGIEFDAHDLRDPLARRSPYDMQVLERPGDIKTSLYFLQPIREPLVCQFYITRVNVGSKSRTLVVFLKLEMWKLIDGDTLLTQLAKLPEVLPHSAEVQVGSIRLVVADYQVWKDKVRHRQAQEVQTDD